MGAGKSYWGARLSKFSGLKFIDLDHCIEEFTSKKVATIFEEKGEEGFRVVEREVLQDVTFQLKDFVMACGGGTPCFFNNLEFMKQQGKVVWLASSPQKIRERLLGERAHRPLISKLSEEQLEEYIFTTLQTRQFFYQQADHIIDPDQPTAEELLKKIINV
jgi:shikimate kinase